MGEENFQNLSGGRPEARAEVRAGARELRALFLSLVDEGFSEAQALRLIGYMLAAQGGNAAGGA